MEYRITASPTKILKGIELFSSIKRPMEHNFSPPPLSAIPIPSSKIKEILYPSPSIRLLQEEDTLRYDDTEEGDTVWIVHPSQGAAYIATRFTPPKPCTLKGVILGIGLLQTGQIGFPFGVWDDANGMPGISVVGPWQISVQGESGQAGLLLLNFEEMGIDFYMDPDDFWVGFGIEAGILGVLCDNGGLDYPEREAIGDGTNWTLLSGIQWPENAGDPIIRAIVSYGAATSVEEHSEAFKEIVLGPNPFNRETKIRFHISVPCRTSLGVYNATGRLVCSIIDKRLSAGTHEIDWDGRDDAGKKLPSGIYFYRLITGEKEETGKLILVE